jgi:hypothetical protein
MRIAFVITLVLSTMLVMVSALFATEPTKPRSEPTNPSSSPEPVASSAAPERPKPQSGPAEGIGIRGYWTIEIRNPDGTLATRREFKNALTTNGQAYLSRLLARLLTPGPWLIRLGGASSPCRTFTENFDCILTEARASRPASPHLAKTLVPVANPPLTYSGYIVVPFDGSITSVASSVEQCLPTVKTASCLGVTQIGGAQLFPPSFTEATIPAIPVTAGQQVAASVAFTFSTAP